MEPAGPSSRTLYPASVFASVFVRRMSRGSTPGSSPRESEALSPRDSDDLGGGRVFFGGDSSSGADLSCDATERPPTEASVLGSWLHVGKHGHRASVSGTR